MRAKNEFKFLAEAYNTKLILERVVDGKLMCPEACCGAPVVECTCGEDCPHCNCFMIHKAMKEKGFTNKLLKEGIVPEDERDEPIRNRELPAGHYDTHVRLQRGGRWNAHTVNVRKTDKELIQKFLDQGFRIVKPFDEDNEEIDIGTMVTWNQDGPMKGEVVDVDVEQGIAVVETGFGIPAEKYVVELGELTKAIPRAPREDNEEPKRGITGYQHTDALAQAAFAKKDKVDIDEIDLNRWREYPAEDVMKAVYRRYGKELPSVDSYDWAITWDKKVRPWLKENEGNL